jgi:uncharacterized protein YjiS (DUF1127 family)
MSKTLNYETYEAEAALESAKRLPLSGSLASFLAVPGNLLGKLGAWRRHRLAMQELEQLDDHMLKDIGVNRGEIPRVALYGRDIL